MNNLTITAHARARSAQRNVPLTDLDLLMIIGSEVPDGYFVRDHDYESMMQWLRGTEKKLQRWRGARLIVRDGAVVTTYRPHRRQEKKLLRDAEDQGCE